MNQDVHRFVDKYQILVFIIAAFTAWQFVMTMDILRDFKNLPGHGTFSILRTVEG